MHLITYTNIICNIIIINVDYVGMYVCMYINIVLIYVTGSGKRYTIAHIVKSSYWHHRVELALSYKMHQWLGRQSNLLRSYGRERSFVFVYSKK